MADQYTYQLRQDLSVEQIISFVTKLQDNHRLINKGYLKVGSYPEVPQLNFEVAYDPAKQTLQGNITPINLLSIIIDLQRLIDYRAKQKGSPFILPTDQNTLLFHAFYFQKEFSVTGTNVREESYQKIIISALYDVVTGELAGKTVDDNSPKKPDHEDFLVFSYNLRQGDLVEQWTKSGGVKAFAKHLLESVPVGTLLVPSDAYLGRSESRDTRYFAFEHCLSALSEFHKKFKDYLPLQKNYAHPDDSQEKKALNRLENKNYPFFAGRSVLEQTLITNDELTGKLSTDEPDLREFIELFDNAVKALKKDAPELSSAGASDDVDGGETETEEKKEEKDKSKYIEFDRFFDSVKGQLIGYIYNTYYKETVDGLDDKYRYESRKILLSFITTKIDSRVNVRVIIRQRLSTDWSEYYDVENDFVYNTDDLANLVLNLIEQIADELDFSSEVNQDVTRAVNQLVGITAPEEKASLPGVDQTATSVVVVNYLVENKILDESFSGQDWEKLSSKDKVSYWKQLSLRDRKKFLEEHGFLDYVKAYSQVISSELLQDELAKRSLIGIKATQFGYVTALMQDQIEDDLIAIPPTEFGADPQLFISEQLRDPNFIRLQKNWELEFLPTLEREIDDFVLHNPQYFKVDLTGINTVEEAAQKVNPSINDNQVEDIVDRAATEILYLIADEMNLPADVRLGFDDSKLSRLEIQFQLREYLLAHPDSLPLLFSETQLMLFINKYGYQFIERRGHTFLPLIEERYYEAHRQQVLTEIQQKVGGDANYRIKVDDALHYILTEATLSQVDPEKYIDSLSGDELLALFSVDTKFANDAEQEKFATEFKSLIFEYLDASRKALHLDEKISGDQAVDKEAFTEDLLFLRQQGRSMAPQGGGRLMYGSIAESGPDDDELAEMEEADYEEMARQGYQRQRLLALAIWEAYSEEERAFLEAQNAQQMAAYEWERLLNQQAAQNNQPRSEQKKKGIISKGVERAKDKTAVQATTAAAGALSNLIVPGAGAAITSAIAALPIPDKYKKYLTTGVIGGIVAVIGGGVYLFTHSIGGFLGGILGGIGGFLLGGPAGIFGGWLAGSYLGYGVQKAIEGFFGDVGNFFKGIGDGIGNGIKWAGDQLNNVFGGGSSQQIGSSVIPGAESSVGGGSSLAPIAHYATNLAAPVVTATASLGFVGGIIMNENIHQSFLQRPPELLSHSQDASSQYLDLDKSASPSDLENGETADITYSVTITPKDGYVITVSQVSDEISVLGANSGGSNFEIDQAQLTEQLQPNTQITSPVTIEYTLPNVSGTDIALNNSFTLDFFVEKEGQIIEEQAVDSAVVTIGDPELGCFQFGEANVEVRAGSTVYSRNWPEADKAKVINAYQRVLNNATFMGLICSDGPITFYRIAGSQYGGWALSANSIGMYDLGVTSQNSATYTTIHELGHLMDYRNPGLRNRFQAIWSGSCFTYPYECYAGEPFAEAVALYEIHSFYNFRSIGGTYDFPGLHPTEYAWVRDTIYGGGN